MLQRKRIARGGGPWCGELAHSPEGEGSAFRGGAKLSRRSSSKKKEGWMDEANNIEQWKRVMVVVDQSQESKLALKWALSHVVRQLDVLTLLHVQPHPTPRQCTSHGTFFNARAIEEVRRKNEVAGWELANSFKTIVSGCRPEVEVEILVVEGEKGPTIVAQTKKLRRLFSSWANESLRSSGVQVYEEETREFGRLLHQQFRLLDARGEEEEQKVRGYLINSQWQKNFWLLA